MFDTDRETFQAIFDSIDVGLVLLDRDQRIVAWNHAFTAMCGLEPPVGLRLDEAFTEGERKPLRHAIQGAFESGASCLLTHSLHPKIFPLRTRSGRTLIHDVTVSAVRSEPRRCLIQVYDVTVAANRETVLRERQNARYDAVVENAADVILTFDAAGTIQLANPAALRQFGYSSQELLGLDIDVLFAGEETWRRIRRALHDDEWVPNAVSVIGRRKDGSTSRLELSLSRWRSESRSFVTAILRDVNERHAAEEARRAAAQALADMNAHLEERVAERTQRLREAEEALRQSAKMEAIGQLTGGIAHDFNNLLQGVIGGLELVQRRLDTGRIADIGRFLEGSMSSAKRAAVLTHRLLAFSRRQPVDPRPVNANELIASVEELLRRSIGETTSIRQALAEDLWLVRCDGHQLENALLNLTLNARDALPDGGAVTIATANVVLSERDGVAWDLPAGEYVGLNVIDNGVGMSPEVKERAFDPFYTTKPIGQGTGLGLSMIYGFVRQSDGAVRIESEVGKGTAIQMLLPRYTGEAREVAELEAPDEAHMAGRNEIVLVVEDEPVVRLLIVDVLRELGYQALEAADGESALRIILSAQRIDLLITDIGMPGLNGRQLADAAVERRPGLKILFMTGYAEKAASKAFLGAGMKILSKPVTMEVLASKIREMIEK